ncbi:hypothetical protein CC1G_08648 [Coprinopsis cinerea okayama7|uniref:Uncharacterized protein n=1 Tax=Coprinopsis cinerea (strain Okayama-7 / 130 / ATCC MYA-4618 / FGSC 9003) TaxID=240176 RepID=A8N0V1_COPC7|nr:hypothetical protein CC1G_08648 [Coprinopsis cinerea okayama7\|eukprot:XP_001828502.2 hypothetical protein CC1G_08648 [Coprinopsis cinerea okayama7\
MARPQDRLPRLNVVQPLHMQQPQALYSPALPTGIQSGFHPPAYPMGGNPLQTPMQPFFNPHPPQAPGRPTHQSRNSFAFAGPQPPNGFAVTPVTGHFPRPSMMLGPGQPLMGPNGGHRPHKRQMSIGGPPKAVLGGPARKVSPNPAVAAVAAAVLKKKVVVKLPEETVKGEESEEPTRAEWAREPIPLDQVKDEEVVPPELTSRETFPPDTWRTQLPDSVDVFLPSKETWDILKQQVIEAKLEKLGVERGSGSNVPHIFAPHARAASISSPADPALLLFKLNKLQQSQQNSASNSLAPSPVPPHVPFGLSPPPPQSRPSPGLFQNRHGHTMSLAQPPTFANSTFNPFSSGDSLSVTGENLDRPTSAVSDSGLYPHQGQHYDGPPPLSAIPKSDNRPDFIRGFGLEIPEEEEPEEEENDASRTIDQDDGNNGDTEEGGHGEGDETQDMDIDEATSMGERTAPHSRIHSRHGSRHVSHLSAALSLRSVGGNFGAILAENVEHHSTPPRRPSVIGTFEGMAEEREDFEDVAAVQEWTGSEEEGFLGTETSDDESLGEFSNPSDEERARRQRVERRMRRRAAREQTDEILQVHDQPRRIPNFPLPPETTLTFIPAQREGSEDIISNPSDEHHHDMHHSHPHLHSHHPPHYLGYGPGATGDFYVPRSASGTISPRHLPPLPHSRGTSGHYSIHDPSMAHSRHPSEAMSYYPSQNPILQQHSGQNSLNSSMRKETLNPFAKPFVFGKPLQEPAKTPSTPPNAAQPQMAHQRIPSAGKPLNIAAPEFKPRGLPTSAEFTFRQPDAPQMPSPPQDMSTSEPVGSASESNVEESPAFRTQGREKRPRLGSMGSVEEGDSMSSFRFPPTLDSPQSLRKPQPSESQPLRQLEPPVEQPFSFESFSNVAHFPSIRPAASRNEDEFSEVDEDEDTAETAGKENIPPPREDVAEHKAQDEGQEFTLPLSASKPKRAPLPLDFKHPVSNNTVPAGLFKALVHNVMNGDDRTRRVRSRLGSREVFEHMNRPSMDDSNVQMISRSNRLVTDPVKRSSSAGDDDVFGSSARHQRRNSSLPDALRDDLSTPSRSPSIHPQDLTNRLEAQHISDVLAQMLDDKFTSLRRELVAITRESQVNTSQSGLTPSSEAMIADVVSLFRAQLQDSAARSLEDSQMDARGELDFQMIKDLIDEGHKEILGIIKQQIHDLFAQQQQQNYAPSTDRTVVRDVVAPIVESVGERTTRAVVEAISEFSARQESIERGTPARERDLLLNDMINMLTPILNNLRPETIDYDFLTSQLAQAVKPHISQLIDLASDKRETAGLIIDQLLPLLPSLKGDTETVTMHLINEVRRMIAPIDPFEIKEQVADLVVERLDSRLAVRDKAFNVETVTTKVTDGVSQLLEDLNKVPSTLQELVASQDKARAEQQHRTVEQQERLLSSISNIPNQLNSRFDSVRAGQSEVVTRVEQIIASLPKPESGAAEIKPILEALVAENKKLTQHTVDLFNQQQALGSKVNTIPDVLQSNIINLQNGIAELITSRDIPRRDLDDLRKLNSDYQIQLTKARAAHGTVRVEKDMLGEKLAGVEAERDRLKKQVAELENASKAKKSETATLESRTTELEEALAKALARLQDSDVATQADKKRIAELEKAAKDSAAEAQSLKAKVDALEMEVTFSKRDKEAATQALETLKKQHDAFVTQQSHWDDLRQASEKIDMLTQLIGQADNEELQELRRYRDRTKPLEADYAALQKRVKELETKAANSERTATTAKQSLVQAQQRSSEWERRAREYEGELELTRTKLEQAEETQSQLDADYSLLKIQFEEREADDRLYKDREQKQRDQITALEAKVVRLQEELVKARTGQRTQSRVSSLAASSQSPSPYRPAPTANGTTQPPRPDSRASVSTVNGRDTSMSDRRMSYAPTSNGTPGTTPPQGSVWDSMHAPSNGISASSRYSTGVNSSIHAPKSRYPHLGPSTPKTRPGYSHYTRASAPSPSPSIVSAAPTQGEDGWWS